MGRGRERGGSLAPFLIHRPAQLRRAANIVICRCPAPERRQRRVRTRGVLVGWRCPFRGAMGGPETRSSAQRSPISRSSRDAVRGSILLPGLCPG